MSASGQDNFLNIWEHRKNAMKIGLAATNGSSFENSRPDRFLCSQMFTNPHIQ
jgi:hypothetical protein